MSAENLEGKLEVSNSKITGFTEVNTTQDLTNIVSETPEVKALREVHKILTEQLGSRCTIENKGKGGDNTIVLYDKIFKRKKPNEPQIYVRIKKNGLIYVELRPHYAPRDFFFRMEDLDLEKFTQLSRGFKYILNKSSLFKVYKRFYEYEILYFIRDYGQ